MAPTAEATERFVARMHEALPNTVFVHAANWYSDQEGTPILWPLTQDEHKAMLADVRAEDLEFIPLEAAE